MSCFLTNIKSYIACWLPQRFGLRLPWLPHNNNEEFQSHNLIAEQKGPRGERREKQTEWMNENRKSLRENRHHAHVWLSHYNILEKQLLSTAGMES